MSADRRRATARSIFLLSIFLCLPFTTICAAAQQPQIAPRVDALQQLNDSLQQLVSKVSPAIVRIEVLGYSRSDDEEAENHVVTRSETLGSGVILDSNGYIVTNAHVVDGARRILVVLDPRIRSSGNEAAKPGARFSAKIVGTFPDADLAVLKIDATDLPVLMLADSDSIQPGQLVLAVGNPEGLNNSVSMGIISAVARESNSDRSPTYVQTDAAINPGSSGGALVDIYGNLVGITTFILTEGGGSEGLGFVLPSEIVSLVYEELKANGHVRIGDIGVRVQAITTNMATALRLTRTSGLIVCDVVPNSPAETAGIHVQDIITSIDGRVIDNVPAFATYFYRRHGGDHVKVDWLRGSSSMSASMIVRPAQEEPEDSLRRVDVQNNAIDKLGIIGATVDNKTHSAPWNRRSQTGVLVVGELAQRDGRIGLGIGDVITAVNGAAVQTVEQLRTLTDQLRSGEPVVLQIERNRRLKYLAFELD